MTILDNLHQVHTLLSVEWNQSEVINDEQLLTSNRIRELCRLPLKACDLGTGNKLLHVGVDNPVAVVTCGVPKSAGQEALAASCGTGNQNLRAGIDVFTGGQMRDEGFIDASLRAIGEFGK